MIKIGGGFVQEQAVILDETSSTSCALTSSGGRVHLAWTGSDYHLNLVSSPGGVEYDGKYTSRHRSYSEQYNGTTSSTLALAPALATTPADGPHLAWTGGDGRLNVWCLGLGDAGHLIVGERSSQAPALAPMGDGVMLAWTGTDRRLNLLHLGPEGRGETTTLAATSSHSPALCGIGRVSGYGAPAGGGYVEPAGGGYVEPAGGGYGAGGGHGFGDSGRAVLAWTGTDRQLNIVDVHPSGIAGGSVLPQTSADPPALVAAGDEVVLGWTGVDRHVNLLAWRDREVVASVHTEATSSHGPALAVHNGRIVLAWTGTDRRINVSVLRRAD